MASELLSCSFALLFHWYCFFVHYIILYFLSILFFCSLLLLSLPCSCSLNVSLLKTNNVYSYSLCQICSLALTPLLLLICSCSFALLFVFIVLANLLSTSSAVDSRNIRHWFVLKSSKVWDWNQCMFRKSSYFFLKWPITQNNRNE